MDELFERLASIEHERWGDWQRYLHGLCARREDGCLVIPAALVARWERQIATPYADLTEQEREADREQVRRYWALLAEHRRKAAAWDELDADFRSVVVLSYARYDALERKGGAWDRAVEVYHNLGVGPTNLGDLLRVLREGPREEVAGG